MKIDAKDSQSRNYKLLDETGQEVVYCKSFDTETKEAELYVIISKKDSKSKLLVSEGKVVTIKITLPNATLKDRRTGEVIK